MLFSQRIRDVTGKAMILLLISTLLSREILSIEASQSTSTTASSKGQTQSNIIRQVDLSYLHRTQSKYLKQAIQEELMKADDADPAESTPVLLDITASWIGKSVHDLIESLSSPSTSALATATTAESPKAPVNLHLIAQRNQWSIHDTSLLLKSLLTEDSENSTVVASPTDQSMTELDLALNRSDSATISMEGNVTSAEATASESSNSSSIRATVPSPQRRSVESLDLGWNDLHSSSGSGSHSRSQQRKLAKAFHKLLQELIASPSRCPKHVKLQVCALGPSACRAIGKGIMGRFDSFKADELSVATEADGNTSNTTATSSNSTPSAPTQVSPVSLYLTRNGDIGDPGVAALSAAIRTAATSIKDQAENDPDGTRTVLDCLDLSGCGITDVGAKALAIALQDNPLCVRHLDLSNNLITNEGAAFLGRALASIKSRIDYLDLSNNPKVDDAGARELAPALEAGNIQSLVLRSCRIHADGAAIMVRALKSLSTSSRRLERCRLDLSGNPLGILRKKTKAGKSKYSASALKEKATATTTAYMSLIGKTVQKGLKDLGISENGFSPNTLESDDEEDDGSQPNEPDDDPSKIKYGALAIADALLEERDEDDTPPEKPSVPCKVDFGLRHCSFDTRGAEALAAIRQEALVAFGMNLSIDVRMNNVLEEDTVAALRGDPNFDAHLSEMAERYLEGLEALRAAKERSLAAAKAAAARLKEERDMDDAWGAPVDMGEDAHNDYYDRDESWDSDADYDDEYEY